MTRLTRRRFLAISAAAVGAGPAQAAATARWRGIALGAKAKLHLVGLTRHEAAPIFDMVTSELSRLEDIFSLYRPTSAISTLNRNGNLKAPPAELLQLCSLVDALHTASNGAFDPTVQPLWALVAQAAQSGGAPRDANLQSAWSLVNWSDVHFGSGRIRFARPGMAITLNGIAQGFVTDRIADKLRGRGLTDILVDFGELRASGQSEHGKPWRAGIAQPGGDCCTRQITLSDRALATSAAFGTVLDAAGQIGHILDPRTGQGTTHARVVSVSAPTAAVADGLSTALCAMDPQGIDATLAAFPDAKVEHLAI